jgi:hypothetical protein
VPVTTLINIRDYEGAVAAGDWTPAFAAALADVTSLNGSGIFVPAHEDPYTCKKPAGQTPSIAISERTGFILIGEGPGSVIQMIGDGGGGSWDLIKIFKNSSDITIRDLVLDGNKSALTNVDPGEQTHCLKIGGGLTLASGDPRAGYVRDVKLYNVDFKNADGDGIFLSGAGKYTEGADVSDISIVNCRSTGHGRNGLSVQKCVQKVRIFGFYTEGNDNAAIDLEPTGSSEDDAPREFKIMYCTLADQNASTRMSLSGLSSVVPPRQHARSIVAFNHVIAGKVGGIDIRDCLFAFNVIEHGVTTANSNNEPVLQLRGRLTGLTVANNILTRPPGCAPGKVMAIEGQGGFFPDGVDVIDNQLVQSTHGQAGDAFIASAQNTKNLRFSRNTLISRYAGLTFTADKTSQQLAITGHGLATKRGPCRLLNRGGALPAGLSSDTDYYVIVVNANTIKLATSSSNAAAGTAVAFSDNGTGTHRLDVRISAALTVSTTAQDIAEVDLSDNRVIGDAGGCSLISGFTASARFGFDVDKLAMSGNHFYGCDSRYTLSVSGGATFPTPPIIAFTGGGTFTSDIDGLSSVGVVQIGGNEGGVVSLMGNGDPEGVVTAKIGSIYQRADGSAGACLYIKESGLSNTGWVAV